MSAPVFAPWDEPEASPLIAFRGVQKRFGDFTAIHDLSLDIFEREFFALLGPSGCGKTTLMRMLAGFETPSAGTIHLDGADMGPIPPNRRPVNMMFQSYALFPHLSIWDNIAFGLRREGMGKEAIAARVAEMLRLTRLERFAARKPDQISGGQKQRVALARALAKAPKLLLLDEPLAALDKKLRQETQFELMDIQEKTGTTFVIVTHDQEEAMTVASRVAVMEEGRLRQVATPDQIYEAPNSVYVADFIGEVTILTGTVHQIGPERYELHLEEGDLRIEAMSDRPFEEGQLCHLAIRPEKMNISKARPGGAENAVMGRVLDIAYLGNVSTYHVELPGGQVIKTQMTNADRISKREITWEDTVWVSWSAGAGVLLDR